MPLDAIPAQRGFIVRCSTEDSIGVVHSSVSGTAFFPQKKLLSIGRAFESFAVHLDYPSMGLGLEPVRVWGWMEQGAFVSYDCLWDANTGTFVAHNLQFLGKPHVVIPDLSHNKTQLMLNAVVTRVVHGRNAHMLLWNDCVGRIHAPSIPFDGAKPFDVVNCVATYNAGDALLHGYRDALWTVSSIFSYSDYWTDFEKIGLCATELLTSDGWEIDEEPTDTQMGRFKCGNVYAYFRRCDVAEENVLVCNPNIDRSRDSSPGPFEEAKRKVLLCDPNLDRSRDSSPGPFEGDVSNDPIEYPPGLAHIEPVSYPDFMRFFRVTYARQIGRWAPYNRVLLATRLLAIDDVPISHHPLIC